LFLQKGNCFFATARDTIFHSNYYVDPGSKNIVLLADGLRSDTLYTATCLYARDSLARTLDSARNSAKIRLKRIAEKDIPPTTVSRTEPSRVAASDFLPGQPIRLYYNQPVSADTMKFRISINEDSVGVVVKQVDAIQLEITSDPPFSTDSRVRLFQIEKDSIADTLTQRMLTQFNTISRLKLASLKGEIPGGDAQTIVVLRETTASRTGRSIRTLGREWRAECDDSGFFEIKNLPSGTYQFMYFKDLNGDGRLNSGSIFPLQEGEPWFATEEELILPPGDDNVLNMLLKLSP
jgi:hypothetical protein